MPRQTRRKRNKTQKGGNKLQELVEQSRRTGRLDLSNQNLTSLPTIPESVTVLYCSNNRLTSLPELPPSLKTLSCENNRLFALPPFPPTLEFLFSSYNQLTSLPNLPDSMKILKCASNQLRSLPDLPKELTLLECSKNHIARLPPLPPKLTQLDCFSNELTVLPDLPNSLKSLICFMNPFQEAYLTLLKEPVPLRAIREYQAEKRKAKELGRHLVGIRTFEKGKLSNNVVSYMGTLVSGIPRTMNEQLRQTKEIFQRKPTASNTGTGV